MDEKICRAVEILAHCSPRLLHEMWLEHGKRINERLAQDGTLSGDERRLARLAIALWTGGAVPVSDLLELGERGYSAWIFAVSVGRGEDS